MRLLRHPSPTRLARVVAAIAEKKAGPAVAEAEAPAAASGEWDVHGGPSEVWGAHGMGRSLYVRDPDGNVVELRVYPS